MCVCMRKKMNGRKCKPTLLTIYKCKNNMRFFFFLQLHNMQVFFFFNYKYSGKKLELKLKERFELRKLAPNLQLLFMSFIHRYKKPKLRWYLLVAFPFTVLPASWS